MPVPKTDALPLGYTPYGRSLGRGGREKQGSKNEPCKERTRGYSECFGSPFKTDYNKLATLIETNGKLSALFACNAMPIKVGERFCNLRLVTLFAFGMKMDEQALEPGTDEIRGKHGTGHYTGGARHDRDLRLKYR